MKNILALYPAFSRLGFFNAHEIISLTGGKYDSPPLGLLTVAALLPDNWNVRLVDLNIQDLDESTVLWADIVLISAMLYQQTATVRFIDYFQEKGVKVAVGGPDPTFQPHIYQKADYLVLGRRGPATAPRELGSDQEPRVAAHDRRAARIRRGGAGLGAVQPRRSPQAETADPHRRGGCRAREPAACGGKRVRHRGAATVRHRAVPRRRVPAGLQVVQGRSVTRIDQIDAGAAFDQGPYDPAVAGNRRHVKGRALGHVLDIEIRSLLNQEVHNRTLPH